MTETEFLIFLNEKICDIADGLMSQYDYCGMVGNKCKGGDPNPCCINSQYGHGLCPFWNNKKCNFRNAGCKLWICESAIKTTDPKCLESLIILESLAKLHGLVRKPYIGKPYSGSDKQPRNI